MRRKTLNWTKSVILDNKDDGEVGLSIKSLPSPRFLCSALLPSFLLPLFLHLNFGTEEVVLGSFCGHH